MGAAEFCSESLLHASSRQVNPAWGGAAGRRPAQNNSEASYWTGHRRIGVIIYLGPGLATFFMNIICFSCWQAPATTLYPHLADWETGAQGS